MKGSEWFIFCSSWLLIATPPTKRVRSHANPPVILKVNAPIIITFVLSHFCLWIRINILLKFIEKILLKYI